MTSAPRLSTLARFARFGLPVPEVVVCGEDVSLGKPDPEPYLLGCELLGIVPSECIVVEDAPAGILAAHAGGMKGLGIARLGDEALLHAAGADLVVTSLDRVDITALTHGVLRAIKLTWGYAMR